MIVGTAGHIDHGKTSLVGALTGVDTDRLKEEKARGISIDLGFAYLPAPNGELIGFVDVPGHERFIHNMLAGATGIDFALLVVSAAEGVRPQTREHLAIIDLLGVERGIVALTKADLAGEDERAQRASEIAALLAPTGLAGSVIVPVSTVTGEGLADLRGLLIDAAATPWQAQTSGRFRYAIDRCFVLPGAGTVVTGTVLSGTIETGDRVIVSPKGLEARVRAIHVNNRPVTRSEAGRRCAINVAGENIGTHSVGRGDMLLDPFLHAPADRIDAELRLLASEAKPLGQWTPVRLHHAAIEVGARIVLLGDGLVSRGEEAIVQLVLEMPIAGSCGDRFIIRDTTGQRTIGGGRFLDIRAPSRKRRTGERLAQLAALRLREPEKALKALLATSPFYVDFTAFARDRALSLLESEALATRMNLARIAAGASETAVSAETWERFKWGLAAALASFHTDHPELPGIGRERLRLQLEPRLPAPTFLPALQSLARARLIALDGAWVRLPTHEVRLSPPDEILWLDIEPLLGGRERFRPPRVRDIASILNIQETEVRRVLKLLGRMGKIDEIAHDHFFLRTTTAEIIDIACDIAGQACKNEFIAAQLRDRLDNGRKVAIQILEFLDRHGVTLRRGDVRRLNKHRLDLFAAARDDAGQFGSGRESSPVGRPDFKSGRGRETVLGGFDSLSLPPTPGTA